MMKKTVFLARKRHRVAAIVENTAQLSVDYNYSFYFWGVKLVQSFLSQN
jgi:hypothetical protein